MPSQCAFTTLPLELRAEIASYLTWRDFNVFRQVERLNYSLFTSDRIQLQFPLSAQQVLKIARLGGFLMKDPNDCGASKFLHTVIKAAGLKIRHPKISTQLAQSPYRSRKDADLMRSDWLGCIHRRNLYAVFEALHDEATVYNTPKDLDFIDIESRVLRHPSFAQVVESVWSVTIWNRLPLRLSEGLAATLDLQSTGVSLREHMTGYTRGTKQKVIAGAVGRWSLEVLRENRRNWGEPSGADDRRGNLERTAAKLKEINEVMAMFNSVVSGEEAVEGTETATGMPLLSRLSLANALRQRLLLRLLPSCPSAGWTSPIATSSIQRRFSGRTITHLIGSLGTPATGGAGRQKRLAMEVTAQSQPLR
ncbi:hypothetical protein BJ508DRAFT_379615 [Ascobolus immersus RN42]|uniref:F-box domain-containing protein n=1 Tax=Ascobolus immersus RN42 TaxID=1160509 RepID=A0A3N4HT16_ASCIM|nr:hypothetical protein BJ508DRAFT_379615 [Ascobolus immersus RN42]